MTDIHSADEAAMAAEYVDVLQIPASFAARPICWLQQRKPEKQLTSKKDSSFLRWQCSLLPIKWWNW